MPRWTAWATVAVLLGLAGVRAVAQPADAAVGEADAVAGEAGSGEGGSGAAAEAAPAPVSGDAGGSGAAGGEGAGGEAASRAAGEAAPKGEGEAAPKGEGEGSQGQGEAAPEPPAEVGPLGARSIVFTPMELLTRASLPAEGIAAAAERVRARMAAVRRELEALRAATRGPEGPSAPATEQPAGQEPPVPPGVAPTGGSEAPKTEGATPEGAVPAPARTPGPDGAAPDPAPGGAAPAVAPAPSASPAPAPAPEAPTPPQSKGSSADAAERAPEPPGAATDGPAPYEPGEPPPGPGAPYLPADPLEPGASEPLVRALDERAAELEAALEGAPDLGARLQQELFEAVARAWACGAAPPEGGCGAAEAAVADARARIALAELQADAARAELELLSVQRAWVTRAGAFADAEQARRAAWERERAAWERAREQEAAARAEAEALARAERERAEREARELAAKQEASRAALEKAKAEQEEYLQKRKAEELRQRRDSELEDIYQGIVDATAASGVALEELGRRAKLRQDQRARAHELIEYAFNEDVHVGGLIRKVRAAELEAKVLDARHEEYTRRQERARAVLGDDGLVAAEAAVQAAEAELRRRAGDVEVVETDTEADAELQGKRVELARLLEELARLRLDAAVAERDRLAIVADLRKAERIFYSSMLRRIAPHLSATYRAQVLEMGEGFAMGLLANLVDLGERLTDLLSSRLEDVRELPDRISSWQGITSALWYMAELALVLVLAFWARRRLSGWLVRMVQGSASNLWMRRHLVLVVSVAKIVDAVGRPAILLLGTYAIGNAVGRGIPEVEATLFVLTWFFVWRMLIELMRTLFLPGKDPAPGAPVTLAAIDPAPVVRLSPALARTAWQSAWALLHYAVIRTAVMVAVESLLGRFYLYRGLTILFDVGLAVVVVTLTFLWRSILLGRFADAAPPTWGRTIAWVRAHRDRVVGILAVPPVVVWLLLVRAWPFLRQAVRESSLGRSTANWILRRRMERAKGTGEEEAPEVAAQPGQGLPADYVERFALRPLVDEPWHVDVSVTPETVLEVHRRWNGAPTLGAVAIVGEPGIGKTTILNQVERRLPAGTVRRLAFDSRVRTARQLFARFAEALGLDEIPASVDELKDRVLETPGEIWLVDDAHRLFLKTIGGMEALDAFFELISATSLERFWVTTFDAFTWYFVQSLRRGSLPYTKIVREPAWREDHVRALVEKRTEATPYTVSFEDLVVTRGEDGAAATYQVVKTAEGYYRLLTDYADGNPAVALNYWLRSLTPRGGRRLSVGLFSRRNMDTLANASDDVLFLFTSIAEHSGMPVPDLARVLGVEEALVHRHVQKGVEWGLLAQVGAATPRRVVIHFDAFRQVIGFLRTKNFIYYSTKE